jgi:hypothetical protein
LQVYSLAKHIIMTDKSLRSFSALVSVAIKHFTGSDGIYILHSSSYVILCECVCILPLVIWQANHIYYCATLYCHLWHGLLYNMFPHYLISGKKGTEHTMCVSIFSTIFVWNISHFKNSSRCYHKRTSVFT